MIRPIIETVFEIQAEAEDDVESSIEHDWLKALSINI
jgi:hypothetical protein